MGGISEGQATSSANFLQNFDLTIGYDFTQLQVGENSIEGSGFQLGFGPSFKLGKFHQLGVRANFSRHTLNGADQRSANFYRANGELIYQFVPLPHYLSVGTFLTLGTGILESGHLSFPGHTDVAALKTSGSVEIGTGVKLKLFDGAIELTYGYHQYPGLNFSNDQFPPVAADGSAHSVTIGVDVFKVAHLLSRSSKSKSLKARAQEALPPAPKTRVLRANPIPEISQREIALTYFNDKFAESYAGDHEEDRKRIVSTWIVDPLAQARESGKIAKLALSDLASSLLKENGDVEFLFKIYTVLIDPETQNLYGSSFDKKELADLLTQYQTYVAKQDRKTRFKAFQEGFKDASRKFLPEDVLTLLGIFGGQVSEEDAKSVREFYSALSKKNRVEEAMICEKALALYLDEHKDIKEILTAIQNARAEQNQVSFETQAFKALSPSTLLGKEHKKFPKMSGLIGEVIGYLKQEKTEEEVKQAMAVWQKSSEFKQAASQKAWDKLTITVGLFDGIGKYQDKVDRLLNHLLKFEKKQAYIGEGKILKTVDSKTETYQGVQAILKSGKMSYAEFRKLDGISGIHDVAMLTLLYTNLRRGAVQAVGITQSELEKKLKKHILSFLELTVQMEADPKNTYKMNAREALFWSYILLNTAGDGKYPAQTYLQSMLDALGATSDGDKVFQLYLPAGMVKYKVK